MFVVLNKCDINDPAIPKEVKDFYEQVNKDSWIASHNHPFDLHISEVNSNDYSFLLHLEHTCISVGDFGTHDIKEATVGVTFESDKPKQHIYASVGNIPRDEVGKRVDEFFDWIGDLVDNPHMNFLDIMNCSCD